MTYEDSCIYLEIREMKSLKFLYLDEDTLPVASSFI